MQLLSLLFISALLKIYRCQLYLIEGTDYKLPMFTMSPYRYRLEFLYLEEKDKTEKMDEAEKYSSDNFELQEEDGSKVGIAILKTLIRANYFGRDNFDGTL